MTDDTVVWEPVSSGGTNDYPLAFVNVDMEEENLTLNVDGEDIEPDMGGDEPFIQGTYQGLQDISAEDNPQPSLKHLIESEIDERTYAINNLQCLSNEEGTGEFDQVEEGEIVGVDFEGVVRPEDGLPWQNFRVYRPAQ